VGVPDFVVSGLASAERVHLSVSAGEAAELARLCRLGGNEELARLVEGAAMSGAKAVSKTGAIAEQGASAFPRGKASSASRSSYGGARAR
jgi:hypothetical protein